MKRGLIFLFIAVFGCFLVQPVTAAMLTVNVDGLDLLPNDSMTGQTDVIWSYQIDFTIEGDLNSLAADATQFNTTTNQNWEAAPGIFVPYWQLDSGVNGNRLVILATSNDELLSPLKNGELFTVTYPDELILSLTFDSFLLASDLITPADMITIPDLASFGEGNHVLTFTTQAVPIPSALLLLGGGLVGLVGIRRKTMK